MDELVLAFVFLAAVGLVPARVVARSWGEAVPLAAPVTGLVGSAAAVGALLTGAPLLPWLLACTGLAWTVALIVAQRRRGRRPATDRGDADRADGGSPVGADRQGAANRPGPVGLATTAVVALVSVPVLGTALVGPTAYDARMIWWFHAAWFWRGGDQVAAAMGNAFLNYNHPQYPPLASASVGSLWSVARGGDFWVAQALSAAQSWLGLVLVAVLGASVARGRARLLAAAVGGLFVVAGVGLGEGFALRGYADVTWSAFAAAGAVAGLVLAPSAATARLAAVCFAAAALTKAEGLTVVAGVLVPLVVARWALVHRRSSSVTPASVPAALPTERAPGRRGGGGGRRWLLGERSRRLWPLVWIGVGVAAAVAWLPIAYHYTPVQSEALSAESVGALLRGDDGQVDRLGPTLSALWDLTARPFVAVTVLTVAGWLLLGSRRRALGLGAGGWLLAGAAGAFAAVTLIYVAGRQPLDWWLSTSAERTVTIIHLLLLTEALVWAAVALDVVVAPLRSALGPALRTRSGWHGVGPVGSEPSLPPVPAVSPAPPASPPNVLSGRRPTA